MKKNKNTRKPRTTAVSAKVVKKEPVYSDASGWSWSIYVYWFIILFFIAATFYILGRSHEFMHPSNPHVIVSEEALIAPSDYVDAAREKLMAGDIEGALSDLNAAIDANASSNLYALRGEAYMHIGDYQKALEDFNSSIEVDNMNAVAFYDRCLLNMRLENYEAALEDVNNALAAQSRKPADVLSMRDLYAKRGQLNLWLKNWEGAIADYTNSLARAEGSVSADVYAERAEAYTAIGRYAEAVNDYTSAVRVISEQIQALPTQEEKEAQSSNAMGYFEKSAALNFQMDDLAAARSDLESAFTLAVAINDEDSINRIRNLIEELQ